MKTKKQSNMKTIFKLAMLATILIMVSCSKEEVVEPVSKDLTATAVKSGKKVTKPIKNSIVAIDNEDATGSTFTGNMSHLGKINGTVETESFLPNSDGSFTYKTAIDVINAANGDVIYTKTELNFIFTSATTAIYTGGFVITGGTGRFEGATGSMTIANGQYEIIGLYPNGNPIGRSTHNAVGSITY